MEGTATGSGANLKGGSALQAGEQVGLGRGEPVGHAVEDDDAGGVSAISDLLKGPQTRRSQGSDDAALVDLGR